MADTHTYDALTSFTGSGFSSGDLSATPFDDISSAADNEQFQSSIVSSDFIPAFVTDDRLRLRAKDEQKDQIYGTPGPDNVLSIMHPDMSDGTNGLLFPFTPTITFEQAVSYKDINLTHTNGGYSTYEGTPYASVTLSGKFAIQNQRDGAYAIAVIHFLRTVSKMYFGEEDKKKKLAGLPPPVLLLDGYGNGMFNELPVIVKGHNYTFDDTHDQVVVTSAGLTMRLPTVFTISISLSIQQTPSKMRTEFSLDKFRTGELMRTSKGWI